MTERPCLLLYSKNVWINAFRNLFFLLSRWLKIHDYICVNLINRYDHFDRVSLAHSITFSVCGFLDCFCSHSNQTAIDSNRKFTLVSLFGKLVDEKIWNFRSSATITQHTHINSSRKKITSFPLFFLSPMTIWIDFTPKCKIYMYR